MPLRIPGRTGRPVPVAGPGSWARAGLVLGALAVAGTALAADGAAGTTMRLAAATNRVPKTATPARPIRAAGVPFGGTPAVGALFSTTGRGRLGRHFCTASVVRSPHRDLLITAAHCVQHPSRVIDFVPGYADGRAPYGVWTVTRIIVDRAWSGSADPDDDVAFLTVRRPGAGPPIEDVTGAEQLGIGRQGRLLVQVIGYPDGGNRPVTCRGRTSMPWPHQFEFDCRRYTEGTSGGPFLLDVDPVTGDGTVVGVIGGYQRGGDLPQISYSATFGQNVAALYRTAIAQG